MDYHRFRPKGRAYIELTSPQFTQPCLTLIKSTIIGGNIVTARITNPAYDNLALVRTRGIKGRSEAMERGVLNGNGPDAGISHHGKTVVVSGLPGRLVADSLKQYIRELKLGGTNFEVLKTQP